MTPNKYRAVGFPPPQAKAPYLVWGKLHLRIWGYCPKL